MMISIKKFIHNLFKHLINKMQIFKNRIILIKQVNKVQLYLIQIKYLQIQANS